VTIVTITVAVVAIEAVLRHHHPHDLEVGGDGGRVAGARRPVETHEN
jgi:hypothetical protein